MSTTGRTLILERNEEAPQAVRKWIEGEAVGTPEELRATLCLLTHELVTNAVRHSEGQRVWISLFELPRAWRVEVADQGGVTEPALLPAQPFATSGNGLRWVQALADEWGIDLGGRVSVWFQLGVPATRTLQRSA